MAGVAHIPAPSVEELRQKRLAYFTVTHQQTHPVSSSEGQSLETAEELCRGGIPVQLNISYSHSENDNITQNINSLSADGSHVDRRPKCWSSESMKLAEELSQRHHDVKTNGGFDVKGSSDHHGQLHQESLVGRQPHMFVDFPTEGPNLQVGIGQRNKDHLHNPGFSNSGQEETKMHGYFSKKITEEIKSVLGEEGLRNIMMNVARDLKQLNGERSNPFHGNELKRKDSDSACEVMDRTRRSSVSSLVQSSSIRHQEHSGVSSINSVECQTPSLRSSTITRNLQQLKEGEHENITLARNYDQITVPTTTKNAFSSEEIYRQAFGDKTVYLERQHSGHTHPELVPFHWQDRLAVSQHSHDRSSYPHYDTGRAPPPPHFSPPMNSSNMFSFPPPQAHVYFDPQFNHPLFFPRSPGSPTTHFVFQNGTPPFRNQQYRSATDPQQYCQDVTQKYTGYKPVLPDHSSSVFQQPPVTYFYPPPAYPDPHGRAVFLNRTPVHLPPPPVPQYVQHLSQAPQHQPPPHLSTSARPDDASRLGSPNAQVQPNLLLGGQFVRAPHPPPVPPALQPRIEPHVSPHRRLSDGNTNASPKHQPENRSPENYTLQKYFSSLEMYSSQSFDSRDDVTVASTDKLEWDHSVANSEARTAFTDVTETSTEKIGGLTQRLQDLDIGLDHLKHLRMVDDAGGPPQALQNAEVLPHRIKHCPECSSLNKAYMDCYVVCGEVLIGIEPTFYKSNSQVISSQQKNKAVNPPVPNKRRTCLQDAEIREANTECAEKEFSGKRSEESGKDLCPPAFPVQSRLEEITSVLPRDKRKEYEYAQQKNDKKQELPEGEFGDKEYSVLVETDKEESVNDMNLNADHRFLEEIEDPLIREFAISYRKRQLLQQKNNSVQIAHRTSDKCSVKSEVVSSSDSLQDVDLSVTDNSFVTTSVAATSGATSQACVSPTTTSVVATLGSPTSAVSTQGAVKHSMSTPWKKDAVDIGQNRSYNVAVSDVTSDYIVPAPGPPLRSSAPDGGGEATNDALLQPFIAHVKTISNGNTQSSTDQHQVNKNRDLHAEASNEERKMIKKKKKKKQKLRGETVDIEIFGYNETQKSSSQPTSRVVPALNLKSSSDEEDDNEKEDDDDYSEETEDETVDDDVSDFPASSDFDKQINTSNPAKSYNKAQPIRNLNNLPFAKSSQSRPMKTTDTSPPQPSFSQSGASFHRERNRGGVVSGTARYQRHWNRSSIAWSSYNPRELSTRSSLGNSQVIPPRGTGRAPGLSHFDRSRQEVRGESGHSVAPAQRRPSSAGTHQRQPISGFHQRPSSASVAHGQKRPQLHPSTTSQKYFQGYTPATSHGDGFQGYPPAMSHADGFQGYPPAMSHGDGFQGYPPGMSHGDGFQGYPPAMSHRDGFQSYPPAVSNGDGFQMYPPTTPRADSLQTHPAATSHRTGPYAGRQDRCTLESSCHQAAGVPQLSRNKKPSIERAVPIESDSPLAKGSLQSGCCINGEIISEKDSPRLLCAEFHRLPQTDVGEDQTGQLQAVAMNSYQKLHEMTPRITEGQLSEWECLPNEIWLHILSFLSQRALISMMQVSKYFNQLANDETLWKYITVKPKYSLTDQALARIAEHRPVSLAMVKCQGTQVTPEGLNYFFQECQLRLKELNICGCSQGALVGTEILKAAALGCKNLTHLDASFCNVSDESFIAVCRRAEKLESVCLNGFQSMKDSTLLVLLKKHGKSLRTLELYACFSLSSFAFVSIGQHCRRLRRLCLGSCNKLSDTATTKLCSYLRHIEELDLRGSNSLRNDSIGKIVVTCPRIHTLVLANCHRLSDVTLMIIAGNLKTTIRALDVCGCECVTDAGVAYLAESCGLLTTLDISSTRCTGASVQKLAESSCSQRLETVKFSFLSSLTEACLSSFISQCPRLKSVHVFGCSSLKNKAKLQSGNPSISIEGDFK